MAKIHLIQSQTPLSEGRDQDVMCGTNVSNMEFVSVYDEPGTISRTELHQQLANNLNVCRKCLQSMWWERYIYAVRERP